MLLESCIHRDPPSPKISWYSTKHFTFNNHKKLIAIRITCSCWSQCHYWRYINLKKYLLLNCSAFSIFGPLNLRGCNYFNSSRTPLHQDYMIFNQHSKSICHSAAYFFLLFQISIYISSHLFFVQLANTTHEIHNITVAPLLGEAYSF